MIWKGGIFPFLAESFLMGHFFLSSSFLQRGGKLSVSNREVTFAIPQDTEEYLSQACRNIYSSRVTFNFVYSESAKRSRNLQVFVRIRYSQSTVHSFNSHMVLLATVLGGKLLHSML